MEFDGYKIKINIKSCCLYEEMTGKNFFDCSDGEDVLKLIYCCYTVNNDFNLPFKTFSILLKNKKFQKWINKEYENITVYNNQFKTTKTVEDTEKNQQTGETKNTTTITEMATTLIVEYNVDAHYVMYEMGLWELLHFYEAADKRKKEEIEERRLWTYIGIAPHIDGKKIKGPADLLPLPWEKETKKQRVLKDLEDKKDLINMILGGNKNGGQDDNING